MFVVTATGGVFDFDRLLAGAICPSEWKLADISIHHARTFRWMGAVKITIAEHVTLASRRGEELAAEYGLKPREAGACCQLHDALESKMTDLPRPLKEQAWASRYKEIEEIGLEHLMAAFGLRHAWSDPRMRELVDRVDDEMLAVEVRDQIPKLPEGYEIKLRQSAPPHYSIIKPLKRKAARRAFEQRAWELRIPSVGS